MDIPFFFDENLSAGSKSLVTLDEATSRHAIQVLRMQVGEAVQLSNGKGLVAIAHIIQGG